MLAIDRCIFFEEYVRIFAYRFVIAQFRLRLISGSCMFVLCNLSIFAVFVGRNLNFLWDQSTSIALTVLCCGFNRALSSGWWDWSQD